MILVIDYKMGNIGSIMNMLRKIGVNAVFTSDTEEIKKADKLILPGVGSFDTGMNNLKKMGLVSFLNKKVLEEKTPILGICLGMQLFAERSEEGESDGLGWIDGEVKRFNFKENNLKIPHMGWNLVIPQKEDVLFSNMPKESRFYFVHSYHFVCENEDNILAKTNYGYDFPSIVKKENIIGVQFHPEKSHKYGMKLLENFVKFY